MTLTREDILATPDVPTEVVHVDEWGGDVIVQGMTADAQLQASMLMRDRDAVPERFVTLACALCIVDETGQPLFSRDEVDALSRKNPDVLQRLAHIAWRLSGMTGNAVEDAVKN